MSLKTLSAHIFQQMPISALWIAFAETFWIAMLSGPRIAALIVFLLVFAIYAIDHAGGSEEDKLNNPGRIITLPIKQIAILSYVAAIALCVWWDAGKLPYVLIPGLAGAAYTTRIAGIRPKDILGIKTLMVATPTALCYAGLSGWSWQAFLLIFLVTIIDTTMCDVRDVRGDGANGVKTVPVLLGTSRTLTLLAMVCIGLAMISPIMAAIGFLLIWHFRQERASWQYDLLVDGWILWAYVIRILI